MKTRTLIRGSLFVAAIGALVFPLTGSICGTRVDTEACLSDADCNPAGGNFWSCDLGSGRCLCTTNAACDPGTEFCNDNGFCQERGGCIDNTECDPPSFCDITDGTCINPTSSTKTCSLDTHCPFGFYCDGRVCQPGCRDSSDCALGLGCVLMTCIEGGCLDRLDCDYGERCVNNVCRPALDAETCTDCSDFIGRAACAADGQHECLINTAYDEANPYTHPQAYCVPKCSVDNDCPNGLLCVDIYNVVDTCTPGGSACANGQQCRVGSEATTGYCPCTVDGECGGPCLDSGLCLASRSCALMPNLQCRDVGVLGP